MIRNKIQNIKVAIIVANESSDIEVIAPYDLWKRAGLIVDAISIEKKNTLHLQSGLKISCNESIEKSNLDKYKAIYLPGGKGYNKLIDEKSGRLSKKLVKFSDKKNNKWLFTASTGAIVLIKTNAIKDQKLTINAEYENEIGDYFLDADILIDKNYISTKGSFNIFAFSLIVIEKLVSKSIANLIANDIAYKKGSEKIISDEIKQVIEE